MSAARGLLLVAVLAIGAPASAQQQSGDGFLFGQPTGSMSLRGGFARPNAGSDLFSFTTSELTLNRGDFSSADGSIELAFTLLPQLDVVLSAAFSGMSKRSEFRDWTGSDGKPIEQTTHFKRNPFTVSARYYLQPRGRMIGHYAWVPARFTPYVGAGAGLMEFEFSQVGDFIDQTTKNVFPDEFKTSGWTGMGQALAGVDWSLTPRWALTTEAKYIVASGDLSNDFSGYHRLDLSGFSTTVGFSVRF